MGNGDDGVGWWKDLRLFEVGLLWPSLNVTYCALNLLVTLRQLLIFL